MNKLLILLLLISSTAFAQQSITQRFIIKPPVGCADPSMICPPVHTYRIYLGNTVLVTSSTNEATAPLVVSLGDVFCYTVTAENDAGESVKSVEFCKTYDGSVSNAPIILELPIVVE